MKNLAHSAFFHGWEKTAPSNPGIKHLAGWQAVRGSRLPRCPILTPILWLAGGAS